MIRKRKMIFILLPIGFLLGLPWVVMMLWNHVVVDIFEIKTITYFQAAGLFLLGRLLFGNFGFKGRKKADFKKRFGKESTMNLSAEEKCQMRSEWKKRMENNENNLK